jgi:hypothetical protein
MAGGYSFTSSSLKSSREDINRPREDQVLNQDEVPVSPIQSIPGAWPSDSKSEKDGEKTKEKPKEKASSAKSTSTPSHNQTKTKPSTSEKPFKSTTGQSNTSPAAPGAGTPDVIKIILRAKSHYQVLNIQKNASSAEIRASYLRLSRQVHPDKHPGENNLIATEAFKRLSKSYEVLSNESSKRSYDATSMFGSFTSSFGGGSDFADSDFDEDSTFRGANQSLFDELASSLGGILTGLLSADSLNKILAQLLEADILDEALQEDILKVADLIRTWKTLRWEDIEQMISVSSQIYTLVMSISSRVRSSPAKDNVDLD